EWAFCYFVVEGTCTRTSGGHSQPCATFQLVFLPAGEAHSDRWHDAGGRCLHLEFDAPWLDRVREHAPVLDRPAQLRGGTPVWLAVRLYRELRSPDPLSPLAVEGLALELLAQAARQCGAPQSAAHRTGYAAFGSSSRPASASR